MDEGRALIEKMFEKEAILFGHFVLSSGRESNYYINVKRVVTDPEALRLMAGLIILMAKKAGIEFDVVAGPELGAVPIATAVALESGKPLAIIRKKPKDYGTKSQIEGEIKGDDRVLLVEDVTTTGKSVLKAAKVVESLGAKVVAITPVVDREEGAEESIKAEGYRFLPLLRVSEILFYRTKKKTQ